MDDTVLINRRVKVWSIYSDGVLKEPLCQPVSMAYQGRMHKFTEIGLRHPTTKGDRMVHVFDVTDGAADYRLEFDAERLTWMLVSVSDRSYAGH